MKYVLTWLSGGDGYFPVVKNYYTSHTRNSISGCDTLANATTFTNLARANAIAELLNARHFLGAMKVEVYTDKQLFVGLLEGI